MNEENMQSEAFFYEEKRCVAIPLNATANKKTQVRVAITEAWKKIAPWWPLKNLIAVNPLQGFEDLPFELATCAASRYFQASSIPVEMESINNQTIKWCQL